MTHSGVSTFISYHQTKWKKKKESQAERERERDQSCSVPGCRRAEGDFVVRSHGAREGGACVVISVAVSSRASVLEELRVRRRLTGVRISVIATATKLRLSEGLAGAPACYALPFVVAGQDAKVRWAAAVEINCAPCGTAFSRWGAASRDDEDGKVVAVNETDVEEVQPVASGEGELGESGGWGGAAGTGDGAGATIAGGTGEFGGGGVGGAESTAPESPRPGRRHREGARLALGEGETGG